MTGINKKLKQIQTENTQKSPKPGIPQHTPDITDVATVQANPAMIQQAMASMGSGQISPIQAQAIQRAYGNQAAQRLSKNGDSAIYRSGGEMGAPVHPAVEDTIEQEQGNGQPLAVDTRQNMENSMGADFSGVRVHNDAKSENLNTALNARAFTTGNDIFFANNEYSPGTSEGDELIAHELTHTVQQGASPQNPQTKMTVNAPNDPYEQEADAVAEQVTGGPKIQQEESAVVARQVANSVGATPALIQSAPIQREEEEKSEEEKQKEEAADKQENAGSAAEEQKNEAGTEKEKAKSADPATEPPQAPEIPSADEPPEAIEQMAAPQIEVAPEPQIPDVSETEEPIPDEEAQSAFDEIEAAAGEEEAGDWGWSAVGPPDWNQEVKYADSFAALFSEEAQAGGEPGNLKLQFMSTVPTQYITNQTSTTTGGDNSVTEPDPQPLWSINKPEHKNFFVNTFVGDTWNKGIDIANQFGGLSTETNIFGIMARLLETVVMITELVTNVLTYIATALLIAAAILGLIGLILIGVAWAMYSIGMALMSVPFCQGVASAMINAALTLLNWGFTLIKWGKTLLEWADKLGKIIEKLTIIRLKMRLAVVVLRILDLLYSLAQPGGDKAKILRQKMGQILDQGTGAAGDGIALGLGKAAGKVPGGPWKQMVPGIFANLGGQAGGGVMGTIGGYFKDSDGEFFGSESPILDDPGGYWVDAGTGFIGSGWKTDDDGEQPDVQLADDDSENGVETIVIEMEGEPEDAPFVVQASAVNIAMLQAEKEALLVRLGWVETNLGEKQEWQENMAIGQVQSQADQAKMEEATQAGQAQVAAAAQFQEVAQQGDAVGKAGEKDSDALSGTMNAFKGNMETGAKKAAEQGAEGGDPKNTEGGAEKASDGMGDTADASKKGAGDAASVQAQAEQDLAGLEQTKSAYEEFDTELDATQSENQEEVEMMSDDREAVIERLAEIEAQLEEEKTKHATARDETNAWTSQAAAQRENELQQALVDKGGEEGVENFYNEVDSNEPEAEDTGEAAP